MLLALILASALPRPTFAVGPMATAPAGLGNTIVDPVLHPQAPLPYASHGLTGNSNYLIYSDCAALKNPSVTIYINSAMNAGPGGFDFQLNANSLASAAHPNGATLSGKAGLVGWQQYIINVRAGSQAGTTDISAFLEPWPSGDPGVANGSDLVNTGDKYHLVTLANTPTPSLPAGTVLTILLGTDPTTYDVNVLTFTVTLPSSAATLNLYSKYYNGKGIPLLGQQLDGSLCVGDSKHPYPDTRFCPNPANGPGKLGPNDMAPITSFQLNFAGNLVNSGAGLISYAADPSTPLTPAPPGLQSTDFPYMLSCSAGAITAESSNVIYNTMSTLAGSSIPQYFNALPSCEAGTSPYFFDCDYHSFCATPANVEHCESEGWCYPLPWTYFLPSGKGTCSKVTPIDERDPQGNWLSSVTYPEVKPTTGCATQPTTGTCFLSPDSSCSRVSAEAGQFPVITQTTEWGCSGLALGDYGIACYQAGSAPASQFQQICYLPGGASSAHSLVPGGAVVPSCSAYPAVDVANQIFVANKQAGLVPSTTSTSSCQCVTGAWNSSVGACL
jgi:hypothetical protein